MKKKTIIYLWLIIITIILILIPFIQNAGSGPGGTGIYFFMGYTKYISDVYLYIISMGTILGVLLTIFVQSLISDLQSSESPKFELN